MYLHSLELAARIRLEKEVEQWLSYEREINYNFIRWLIISRDNNHFSVTYYESFDDGDTDFYDVREFPVLDSEDNPFGITNGFNSVEEAIYFACEEYGADANRFTVSGMIQKEYLNYLRQNKQ